MRGLSRRARERPVPAFVAGALGQMDRRLLRDVSAPVAVAISGGGDSTALLRIAGAWARGAGRRLVAFTVDHQLNPAGPAWTRTCAALAASEGADFQALAWTGPKPTTGLPAAARAARHALLADAARAADARVILMGHTASDLAEAAAMRAEGSTAPDPRPWAPSPAWPQGRDLFLLRPLLQAGRTPLRAWLAEQGVGWIDDPANEDQRFARARARALGGAPAILPDAAEELPNAAQVVEHAGVLTLPTVVAAGRLVRLAAVCAGGRGRIPSGTGGSVEAVTTLAGARIIRGPQAVLVHREPGEARRGALGAVALPAGQTVIWDGRFEVTALREGLTLRGLDGVRSRLPAAERRALGAIPASARGALPALVDGGAVSCPLVTEPRDVAIRSLVGRRFAAAAGLVAREPA